MLMLVVLLLGVLFALWRGGRVSALERLRVRYLWLFFVPLLLQLAVFPPFNPAGASSTEVTRLVYLLSMCAGAVVLLLNRNLPGLGLVAAGLVCNLLVITLNGGFMPVSPDARTLAGLQPLVERSNNVVPMDATTVLWWLGDLLPVPAPMRLANVFSPGDVLITVGALRFIYRALLPSLPETSVAPSTASSGLAVSPIGQLLGLLRKGPRP